MPTPQNTAFIQTVYTHYHASGRHDLPWRHTTDPYKIAVSELMLQQTQVGRVIPKYKQFLERFPTVLSLAKAPLKDVLSVWLGLGYNRRAKFLHQMAQAIVKNHKGTFPKTIEGLRELPGIGPYTAGAIATFAYNQPHVMIETNIRTVYIHHFFPNKKKVTDKEIEKYIAETLDQKKPREWYWALMDYGSHLKQSGNVVHRKSKTYAKQSAFNGSKRQIRGAILRLLASGPMNQSAIIKLLPPTSHDIGDIITDLTNEGFISKKNAVFQLK